MPKWLNIALQSVATAGQVFNAYGALMPPKYQVQFAMGLGVVQTVVGVIAHNYNPDGTPAIVAYLPKDPKEIGIGATGAGKVDDGASK